jgi:branched-subunit amino acid transport protein AzlD
MNASEVLITILVCAAATMVTRFLPFVALKKVRSHPYVTYLSEVLSGSVIGLLVVYSLKDVELLTPPYGICEIISVIWTAGIHYFRKNALLSIISGTILYMVLIQVF